MRLLDTEKESILRVFKEFTTSSKGSLYLIGSRTDDNKKGGDIDLLFIGEVSIIEKMKAEKLKISSAIQNLIGEQRIDLTFVTINDSMTDPFVLSVLPGAIRLL